MIAMVCAFEISYYSVDGLVRRHGSTVQEAAFHVTEWRNKEEESTPKGQPQTDESKNLRVHDHCGN